MEGIKITIQIEPGTENISTKVDADCQEESVAIYIDKENRVWGLKEEMADAALNTYGSRSQSEILGNSDYIIIFDGDTVIQIGVQKYIMGDCLIMKSDNGLQCLAEDEINDAMREYGSRLSKINIGRLCATAYPLD